ncbi:acetyltransferase [Aliarcobacter butzleri]
MKNLIICGSGELARETYHFLKNDDRYNFKGFLDFTYDDLKNYELYNFYLGNEDEYKFSNADYLLICISDVNIKKRIYEKLKKRNINIINYFHKSVIFDTNTISLGEGNIFAPYTIVSNNTIIGNCNFFNCFNSVGHDVNIGSFNTFSSHNDITGNVHIGDSNYFGSRVSVLPKAIIGNNNKISAGSVIYKKIGNNSIHHGNPTIKVGNNE